MFNNITNNYLQQLLLERVSSVVYHCLPLDAMFNIARHGEMLFSTSTNNSDNKLSYGYPYYLSLSRTKTTAVGYANMRMNTWQKSNNPEWEFIVRLKFNGDLINTRFKGVPVNYFNTATQGKERLDMLNKIKNNEIRGVIHKYDNLNNLSNGDFSHEKYNFDGVDAETKENTMIHLSLEYEDRILSKKREWSDFDKYVDEIDILIPREFLISDFKRNVTKKSDKLYKCQFISQKYGDKVKFFIDDKTFNYQTNRGVDFQTLINLFDYNESNLHLNEGGIEELCIKYHIDFIITYYTYWCTTQQQASKYWVRFINILNQKLEKYNYNQLNIDYFIQKCKEQWSFFNGLEKQDIEARSDSKMGLQFNRQRMLINALRGNKFMFIQDLLNEFINVLINDCKEFILSNNISPKVNVTYMTLLKYAINYRNQQGSKKPRKYVNDLLQNYSNQQPLIQSMLNENELKYVISNVVDKLLSENVIRENITRGQMESALEDLLKSKDFEKKVNHIVIDTLGDFLENMWTKKSFWKTMMKKK